jgi:hypothetical protein
MQLAFAFLSRAAERSQDGTIHAFGAGFDSVQLPHIPTASTPMALVAKFRCEPRERGQVHEVGVDLSDPAGKVAHLVSERLVIGDGTGTTNWPLAATLVAAIDAPFEVEGEHVFHVSLDGTQIASLPLNVLVNGTRKVTAEAMQLRAQWMRELGMSEEEVSALCDPESYPSSDEEEAANLNALRRMRSSNWSV